MDETKENSIGSVIKTGIKEAFELGERKGQIETEMKFTRIISALLDGIADEETAEASQKRRVLMDLWQQFVA